MVGFYLRGPHLGPIHTGVRLRIRSRRGRGDGKLGPALLALVLVGALVVASVKYWYITVPVIFVIAVLAIWRYNSKPAKAARGVGPASGDFEKTFKELNASPVHVRAHVRATAPCLEELAAARWHWTPDNMVVPDTKL